MVVNENELVRLQGSKYVESRLGETLKNVKCDLVSGKKVLFSGTPCQVGALYSYLKDDYDNLITVSLICHGVPSREVFDKYVKSIESKEKDSLLEIKMRNKNFGQKGFNSKYIFKNKTFQISSDKDLYFQAFLKNLTLRESCYDCKFKLFGNPKSDFILGDFWGIDEVVPEFNDGYGISAVILNSPKAEIIFEIIRDRFEIVQSKVEDLISENPTLIRSVKYNLQHYYFLEYLRDYDVQAAMRLALENVKFKELEIKNKLLEDSLKHKNSELERMSSNLQQILSSKRFRFIDNVCNFFSKFKIK